MKNGTNSSLTVEVCYSPHLFELFFDKEAIVVVADIFRATSAICTAFHHGADHVIPLDTLEETLSLKSHGYLVGGERNGEMQSGFDFGNSPFSYISPLIKGSKIAITTTNGTQAIRSAAASHKVAVGSFLNLSSLCSWLINNNRKVIILCAGWKNKFNLEDTLFAGAVSDYLVNSGGYSTNCDSAIASTILYNHAKNNLEGFLENASHRNRLKHLNLEEDVHYCLQQDLMTEIPVLKGDRLQLEKTLIKG